MSWLRGRRCISCVCGCGYLRPCLPQLRIGHVTMDVKACLRIRPWRIVRHVFPVKFLRSKSFWKDYGFPRFCVKGGRTEDRRDMSHESRVTFYHNWLAFELKGYSSSCMAKQMLARYPISNRLKPRTFLRRFYTTSNTGENPNKGIIDLLQHCNPFQPNFLWCLITSYLDKEAEENSPVKNPFKIVAFSKAIKAISNVEHPIRSGSAVMDVSSILIHWSYMDS